MRLSRRTGVVALAAASLLAAASAFRYGLSICTGNESIGRSIDVTREHGD
jgi:hypothetical protein